MSAEQTFGQRLQALREGAGVSQYRLAQLSGVSKQTISRLELGTTQPSWDTVQLLAVALGVEVGAFVTRPPVAPATEPPKARGRPRKAPAENAPKRPRGRTRKRS
jgi:transcriptional regulator with XRE-family HTH domain